MKEQDMILPPGTFMVRRDEVKQSIIIGGEKRPTTGKIVAASAEMDKYLGYSIAFKEGACEEVKIGDNKLLFFTDFSYGVYYLLPSE